jgi:hypothetical protein
MKYSSTTRSFFDNSLTDSGTTGTSASSELLSALSKTSSDGSICEVSLSKSVLLDDKRCAKDVSAIDKRGLADNDDMPVDVSGSVDLLQARI